MFFPWRKVSIVLRITHVPDQALIMNEAWPAHVCFHHHNTMIKNWGKQDDWHLNWIIVIFHTEERVWACTCAFLRLKQTTGNLALFVKKKDLWCVLPKRNGRDTRNSLIWGLGSVQYQQRMCVGRRYWSTYGSVTHGLMVQYLQQTTPRYMKRLTKHVEDKSCGSQNMWKTKHQNNGSFIRNVLLRCRSWSSCCKLPSLTPQRFEGTRKWVGWMKIGLSQLQMALNLTSIQKRGSKSNYTAAGPGMVDLNLQRLKDVAHLMNQLKKAKTEIRELNDEIKEMKRFIYELNLKLHYDDGSWPPIAVPESWGSRPMNDEDPMWSPNPKPKAVRDCWWTLAGMKPWTYVVVWTAEAFVSWEAEKLGWVGGSVSCWQLHSVTTAWPFHIRSKVAGQFNSSWKNMT